MQTIFYVCINDPYGTHVQDSAGLQIYIGVISEILYVQEVVIHLH